MQEDKTMELLLRGIKNISSASKERPSMTDDEGAGKESLVSRQINALKAAIPFLDSEYQRGIFIAVKFLEYRRFMEERRVVSAQNASPGDSFSHMASVIRPNLNEEEKRTFDSLCKIITMSRIMGGKYGL